MVPERAGVTDMAIEGAERTTGQWLVTSVVVFALVATVPLGAQPARGAAQVTQPDVDNTVTRIHLYGNGTAVWTVQIRTRLATQQETEEFKAFRSAVADNTSRLLDPFKTRMQRVVASAANATGRAMEARSFGVSIFIQEVPRRWGMVTYEFTWTNFARSRNRSGVVGDVFQGGFYLAPNDTLEIVVPSGYRVKAVSPPPSDREGHVLEWNGRADFADEHPAVVIVPSTGNGSASGTTTDAATPTAGQTTTTSGAVTGTTPSSPTTTDSGLVPGSSATGLLPLALGGFVGLLALGLGIYGFVLRQRRRSPAQTGANPGDGSDESPGQEPPEVVGEDADILTDAERVERLLEDHQGRLRQSAVAEELDWSPSKTSRVISDMVEEERVEKLQLGRENLLALPDRDEIQE
ncbi:MAG: helix-turn-helix transcriptional regulator [Halodesulfurarchaeum sp.]